MQKPRNWEFLKKRKTYRGTCLKGEALIFQFDGGFVGFFVVVVFLFFLMSSTLPTDFFSTLVFKFVNYLDSTRIYTEITSKK